MTRACRPLKFLVSLACCLFLVRTSAAADLRNVLTDYVVTSWNNKEGLPPGVIWALVQDRDGYLWIGNDAGLFRFDGARFTPWNALASGVLPALPVRSLCLARDGSLWVGFGGAGGVGRIVDDRLTLFGPPSGLSPGGVSALTEDREGVLWAGTTTGLYRLEDQQWIQAPLGSNNPAVLSLYVDDAGGLYAGTAEGVFFTEFRQRAFRNVEPTTEPVRGVTKDAAGLLWFTDAVTGWRSSPMPRSTTERGRGTHLLPDHRGNMWLATGGQGLWRVTPRGDTMAPVIERSTSLTGLLGDGVYSLSEDRDGNIWAGTTEGLNRLTRRKIIQLVDLGIVRGVEVTPSGVWIGTVDGLLQFTNAGIRSNAWKLPRASVVAMASDAGGALWVVSDRRLTRIDRDGPRQMPLETTLDQTEVITADGAGGLWLWDAGRGLLHWDGKQLRTVPASAGLSNLRVNAAYTDSHKRAWFALSDGRVATMAADGSFRLMGRSSGLVAGIYNAFAEEQSGAVWLGANGGLTRYADGLFATLLSSSELPLNGIVSLATDDQDGLWIGGTSGIIHIGLDELGEALANPPSTPHHTVYDRSDGIAGVPVALARSQRAARAADGRLWFTTARGVTILNPRELQLPPPPAPVRIEQAIVDGRPLRADPDMALAAGTHRLEIDFTVINLTSALKTRFRYKLEGFDPDWVESDLRRQVYTNLPPKPYVFRVATIDRSGGTVVASADWRFSIAPMFYQRREFLAACTLAAISLLALAWRIRIRQVRKEFLILLRERARIGREIHDTLLQGLVGLALQCNTLADELESSRLKAKFVEMRKEVEEYIREARQAIADLRSPRLANTLLTTALRESTERAVDGRDIHVTFDLDEPAPHIASKVDEQLLRIGQEAVLNAVHHSRATDILVQLAYDQGFATLRVADNGSGFECVDPPEEYHYGLISMQERAASAGGHLVVETGPTRGTAVTAVIPMASPPA